MKLERKPVIGSLVVFVDPHSVPRPALLTQVWQPWGDSQEPSVNLVFVSGDENRKDSCGRQTEHSTSVPHRSNQAAPGLYWKWPDE
jgi:hypothetical protein